MSNGRHFTPPTPAFRPVDPFAPMVPRSAERVPSCETTQPLFSRVRPVRVDNSAPASGGAPKPVTRPMPAPAAAGAAPGGADGKTAAKSAAPAPMDAAKRPKGDSNPPQGAKAKEAGPGPTAAPETAADPAKAKKAALPAAVVTPEPAAAKAKKAPVAEAAPAPAPVATKDKRPAAVEPAPAPVPTAAKGSKKEAAKPVEKVEAKADKGKSPATPAPKAKEKAAEPAPAPAPAAAKGGKKAPEPVKDKPATTAKAPAAKPATGKVPAGKPAKPGKAGGAAAVTSAPTKAIGKAVDKGKVSKLTAPTLGSSGKKGSVVSGKAMPPPAAARPGTGKSSKGGKESAPKAKRSRGALTPPPGVHLGPGEELRRCEWDRCQKTFVVKAEGRNTVRRFCSGTCRGRASEARTGKR